MGGISVFVLLGVLSAIFYLFLALFVLVVIYLLITYLFESMALFKMCKNRGDSACFLSFLPSYQKYLLGKIAKKNKMGIILMLVDILIIGICMYFYCSHMFSEWLFLLLFILLCFSFSFHTIIGHCIFKMTKIKYADVFTVFSILSLGLFRPIFLFLIRNRSELYRL